MSSPVKLAPGIFWNPSTTAFECCACDDPVNKGKSQVDIILRLAHLRRPCDRVQVLLPSIQAIVAREDAAAMGSIDINSAFIFGRSELFPWKWPDEGDPKQEDLNEASVSSSGVGVNFLTTASTSSTRSPSTSGQSRVEASSTPPTTSLSPPSSQREVGDPAALVWPDGGRTATRPSRVLRKLWRTIGRP